MGSAKGTHSSYTSHYAIDEFENARHLHAASLPSLLGSRHLPAARHSEPRVFYAVHLVLLEGRGVRSELRMTARAGGIAVWGSWNLQSVRTPWLPSSTLIASAHWTFHCMPSLTIC